jgi:hypothetical protein
MHTEKKAQWRAKQKLFIELKNMFFVYLSSHGLAFQRFIAMV